MIRYSHQILASFAFAAVGFGLLAFKAFEYRSAVIAAQQQITALSTQPSSSLKFLNTIVRRDAGLSIVGDLDQREALLAIRDYVYRNFDNEPEDVPGASPDMVYAALGSNKNNMYCGGAGLAYTWALNTAGIPARFVQLAGEDFISGKDLYQTHVTVEAMIDGKWEISDPTYNVSIQCSDNNDHNLSVSEALSCLARKKHLNYQHGKSHVFDRALEPNKYQAYFVAFTRRAVLSTKVTESEESFPTSDWLERATELYKNQVTTTSK